MPVTRDAFVDSNVWLYALIESSPPDPRRAKARQLLSSLEWPVVSTQVIREVSVNLLCKAGVTEAALRELVRSWYGQCRVVEADEAQLHSASLLRERMSVSFWDSQIIAAALAAGCTTLYSEDLQHGQLIEGQLRIVNPFVEP